MSTRKAWRRIAIKVGSALISPDRDGCKTRYLLTIAEFIVQCRARGIQVVLVSSGSVAAGANAFKKTDNPSVAMKKAMAAKGQMDMMQTWDKLFDFPVAQLLITQFDLENHDRYTSVRETAFELLNNNIMPIVNENDAVCTSELRVGDNDNLSAMIASAVDAQCLIICTDVAGLYDKNPNTHDDATLIKTVDTIDEKIYAMAGGVTSSVGTGGMKTKLEAAEKAIANGIETYLVNGSNRENFTLLLEGKNPGTRFTPQNEPLEDHEHWLLHTAPEKGEVIVSDDVEARLKEKNQPIGSEDLINIVGSFSEGDTVLVRTETGKKLAKATAHYSSCVLTLMSNEEIDQDLLTNNGDDNTDISEGPLALYE